MSGIFRPYAMSNADVIHSMIDRFRIKGDPFNMQIDRKAGTMTNTLTGVVWAIPEDWDLS